MRAHEYSASAAPNRKAGVPKFLRFLFEILQNEDSSIISWAHGGTSIQIHDTAAMSEYVLPKYFKHRKYASFQRQLNYFGFRKWTKTQCSGIVFSHPNFLKHDPEAMRQIRRKNHPENPGSRKREAIRTPSPPCGPVAPVMQYGLTLPSLSPFQQSANDWVDGLFDSVKVSPTSSTTSCEDDHEFLDLFTLDLDQPYVHPIDMLDVALNEPIF